MDLSKPILGGVAVAVVVLVGVAAAFGLGLGPFGTTGAPPTLAEPTNASDASFAFAITNVTECGQRCRILETNVTNLRDERAENVTLYIDLYAGGNETIWEGSTPIGELSANASSVQTTRIELGWSAAGKILGNDGNVTFITTVQAANASQQFRRRKQAT